MLTLTFSTLSMSIFNCVNICLRSSIGKFSKSLMFFNRCACGVLPDTDSLTSNSCRNTRISFSSWNRVKKVKGSLTYHYRQTIIKVQTKVASNFFYIASYSLEHCFKLVVIIIKENMFDNTSRLVKKRSNLQSMRILVKHSTTMIKSYSNVFWTVDDKSCLYKPVYKLSSFEKIQCS